MIFTNPATATTAAEASAFPPVAPVTAPVNLVDVDIEELHVVLRLIPPGGTRGKFNAFP